MLFFTLRPSCSCTGGRGCSSSAAGGCPAAPNVPSAPETSIHLVGVTDVDVPQADRRCRHTHRLPCHNCASSHPMRQRLSGIRVCRLPFQPDYACLVQLLRVGWHVHDAECWTRPLSTAGTRHRNNSEALQEVPSYQCLRHDPGWQHQQPQDPSGRPSQTLISSETTAVLPQTWQPDTHQT